MVCGGGGHDGVVMGFNGLPGHGNGSDTWSVLGQKGFQVFKCHTSSLICGDQMPLALGHEHS